MRLQSSHNDGLKDSPFQSKSADMGDGSSVTIR